MNDASEIVDGSEDDSELAAATDAYATREPQAAFHARIAFCLDAHNEAVRAMRYPPAETAKRGGHSAKHVLALEEELATTGKGAYLASLNSPGC